MGSQNAQCASENTSLAIHSKGNISIERYDLNITYTPLFSKLEADNFFRALEEEIIYLRPEDALLRLRGKTFKISRQLAAYGDGRNKSYTFSGLTVYGKPWTPTLLRIKGIVERVSGAEFNFVLVNRYENGNSSVAAHRDNEKVIVPNSIICSVSFGEARDLVFTRKGFNTIKMYLQHGSLLTMKPPTNEFWNHSLPKRNTNKPRINLTFRKHR